MASLKMVSFAVWAFMPHVRRRAAQSSSEIGWAAWHCSRQRWQRERSPGMKLAELEKNSAKEEVQFWRRLKAACSSSESSRK